MGALIRQLSQNPDLDNELPFHCSENWRANFEVIIDYVVEMWRFPLNPHHAGYHYLVAEGNPARKLSWPGRWVIGRINAPFFTFYLVVPCHIDGDCPTHAASRDKVSRFIGPRMYTWTVTWTRRRYDGPEEYPYGDLVEVDEEDYWEDGDSEPDEDVDLVALGPKPELPAEKENEAEADKDGDDETKYVQDQTAKFEKKQPKSFAVSVV